MSSEHTYKIISLYLTTEAVVRGCSTKKCCCSPANLFKKRLWHRCFPVNIANFFKTPFLQNASAWLLLWQLFSRELNWVANKLQPKQKYIYERTERTKSNIYLKSNVNYFKFDILNGVGFCFFDTIFNNFVCKNLLYKCL